MLRSQMETLWLRRLRTLCSRLRNRHFLFLDIVTLSLTPVLALVMRQDTLQDAVESLPALVVYIVVALIIRLAVFYPCGLYSRYWRYATVDELIQTIRAVFYSTAAITILFLLVVVGLGVGAEELPRSLPLLDGLLALLVVGGTRFSVRLVHGSGHAAPRADAKRLLVVGAGVVGQMIVKELRANPGLGLRPVGFLDDDAHKQHLHILNLPVLGGHEVLPEVVSDHRIDQVVIAMPHAPGKKIREILRHCEEAGVPAKTVPGMSAILEDKVRISQLRNVEIEDLLRREPIETDIAAVRRLIEGKRVLVTGGGGSIGSELCRQILRCAPREIAILGHGENSVFEIHNELQGLLQKRALSALGESVPRKDGEAPQVRKASERSLEPVRDGAANGSAPVLSNSVEAISEGRPSTVIQAIIADIRFPKRIRNIIQELQPDIIFHAAAHKHVPLMETNPAEAISNNVFGTKNVLDAALAADVEHFIMISTDKAVNPTSVMGASKRIAELLVMRAARRSGKPYVAVRFGNVLGSRGSVVPTFRRQIAAGGPVTVSHPEMTRYFMTIPEAVQLVLQATVVGKGGEVFMFDMGEPVKIIDLARDLIELSGLEVGRDIDIIVTGIRPGEKLFEELLTNGENYQPTPHEKIRVARNAGGAVPAALDEVLMRMEHAVADDDRAQIVRCLQEIIPEFQPDEIRREHLGPTEQDAARPEAALSEYAVLRTDDDGG